MSGSSLCYVMVDAQPENALVSFQGSASGWTFFFFRELFKKLFSSLKTLYFFLKLKEFYSSHKQ